MKENGREMFLQRNDSKEKFLEQTENTDIWYGREEVTVVKKGDSESSWQLS